MLLVSTSEIGTVQYCMLCSQQRRASCTKHGYTKIFRIGLGFIAHNVVIDDSCTLIAMLMLFIHTVTQYTTHKTALISIICSSAVHTNVLLHTPTYMESRKMKTLRHITSLISSLDDEPDVKPFFISFSTELHYRSTQFFTDTHTDNCRYTKTDSHTHK